MHFSFVVCFYQETAGTPAAEMGLSLNYLRCSWLKSACFNSRFFYCQIDSGDWHFGLICWQLKYCLSKDSARMKSLAWNNVRYCSNILHLVLTRSQPTTLTVIIALSELSKKPLEKAAPFLLHSQIFDLMQSQNHDKMAPHHWTSERWTSHIKLHHNIFLRPNPTIKTLSNLTWRLIHLNLLDSGS
jgi:hypothetical protein